MVREVHRLFAKHKNIKILVTCEYVTGILDELCFQLHEYKPKLVCGATEKDERIKIFDLFNQDNDECKLLITSKLLVWD